MAKKQATRSGKGTAARPSKKRSENGRNARGQFAGQPGPGRKKGTPNKVTVEAQKACAAIVDDPAYREKLLAAARARDLAPGIEAMLWHYAKGKPKEQIEHSGSVNIARIVDELHSGPPDRDKPQ